MTMRLVVCSLITGGSQTIPVSGDYTAIRFPFNAESYDPDGLHNPLQPDTGQTVTVSDPRASLIWPQHTAWATLNALIYWDSGSYTEIRDRFVRDPLNLTTGYDSTCTEDHAATIGGQYIAKNWNVWVHPLTPIGLLVRHNSSSPQTVSLAELKRQSSGFTPPAKSSPSEVGFPGRELAGASARL